MFNSEDIIEIYSFGTQRLLPAVLPASLRRRARVASVIRDDLSVFDDRKDSSIKNLILGMNLTPVNVGLLYIGDRDVIGGRGTDSRRVAHAMLDIAKWIVTRGICLTVIVFVRTPQGSHNLSRLSLSVMELSCTRDIPPSVLVKAIPNKWGRHPCYDGSAYLTAAGKSAASIVTARALGLFPPKIQRPLSIGLTVRSASKGDIVSEYTDHKPNAKRLFPLNFELCGLAKRIKQES